MRRKALDLLTRSPEREPVTILMAALNAVGRELDALVAHGYPAAYARVPGWADPRALWPVLVGIDERIVPTTGSTPTTAVFAIHAICSGCGYLLVRPDRIRVPPLAGCRRF